MRLLRKEGRKVRKEGRAKEGMLGKEGGEGGFNMTEGEGRKESKEGAEDAREHGRNETVGGTEGDKSTKKARNEVPPSEAGHVMEHVEEEAGCCVISSHPPHPHAPTHTPWRHSDHPAPDHLTKAQRLLNYPPRVMDVTSCKTTAWRG